LLIKTGKKYGGGTGGHYFDDSLSRDFTYSHYLNGMVAYTHDDGLESYEFHYISSHDNEGQVQSGVHGNRSLSNMKMFDFDKGDKIYKVEGQLINKTIVSTNGTNLTISIITGLQFFSESKMNSLSYNGPFGEEFTEEVPDYTLGYVTGRSNQYIEQLQFVWYRRPNTEHKK
jgi:hypothetical protein